MDLCAGRGVKGQRPGNISAQGNALGKNGYSGKAMKGRDNGPPFQGFVGFARQTQGDALGWYGFAPSVLELRLAVHRA
jgi:hypothetical protein